MIPHAVQVVQTVGRTPSSARDPLVALFPSNSIPGGNA